MPARASTRSTRTSNAVTHKSSVSSFNARASTASRNSTLSVEIPPDRPNNALRTQVVSVFGEAQRTTASHRKLAVTLRKVQEACCYEPTSVSTKGKACNAGTWAGEFGEDDFNYEFVRCVLRVLPVRKAEGVGDKTVRFVALFLRLSTDRDNEIVKAEPVDEEDASTMAETPATRLTNAVLEAVLPALTAKDKFVRFRSAQLVAHVIESLEALDHDLFRKIRAGLLRRARDKEAMARAQAVLGLSRLAGNQAEPGGDGDGSEDDNSDEDEEACKTSNDDLLTRLLEVLQNDASAEVRRSLLVNLPILPSTLPYLLERARDQDAATRRAVYARLLPALGDFRHLSLSMREKLLRWGLRDRDETVRKAAGRLFCERWIEDCAALSAEDEVEGGQREPNFDALLELLERIDVINSGVDDGVALEAMRGFWDGRPDYRDAVTFDDAFWETLTAESVFMARTFNDFCRTHTKFEALIEEKLPEVTKVAFYLERYVKVLVDAVRRVEEKQQQDEEDEEEDTAEQEFIVEQLLHMALTLDYSDEVGRRKMFALLRQMLSQPELPDDVTKLTVDVLRDLCAPDAAGEREFCSIVLESVADVHDTIVDDVDNEEESFHSARSEVSSDATPTRAHARKDKKAASSTEEDAAAAEAKAVREILINMKCLHMVQCMLGNVAGDLQQNDHLVAMLNNLVVPAVRSHEAPVRERGLVCLGLCALLDRSLAEENLGLFMHFFAKGHAALQITALHILTDILNVHGAALLAANPALLKVYVRALRAGTRPDVQAAAVMAVSKLLLGRVVAAADPPAAELLRTLVVTYFEPASAANQAVRQALNYFLPVFCYARPEAQLLMQRVALDALHALYLVREGLDDDLGDAGVGDGDDMVSLAAVGACLVDWTDPRKCYQPGVIPGVDAERKTVNGDVHLQFAMALLERLGGPAPKAEKKTLAPLLGKLYISPASSEDKIRALYADVCEAVENQLLTDAAGRNALFKIHVSLGKIVNNLDAAADPADATLLAGRRSTSRRTSVAVEDRTVAEDKTIVTQADIKEEVDEDADSDDGTIVPNKEEGESLVDELLSDQEGG